jgi:hypothetical protein
MYLDDLEPPHEASATGALLDDLALFGGRAADDPGGLVPPDPTEIETGLCDMFDALVSTVTDTSLEPELGSLAWSLANLFHRAVERLDRQLDDNERAQRDSQRAQDGSEVRSVELERLLEAGRGLLERRDGLELMRDHAAVLYGRHLGHPWRPHSGSIRGRAGLTSAVIDSRDFLAARRRAEEFPLLPAGARIAFTGGPECNAVDAIWSALDRVHAKHPDMVLLHGGGPRGAERIAACWADARQVAQIVFKPDWTRWRNAAPFKRNDQLLEALPIGVVVFPGNGISDNLADKAKAMGVPRFDFRPSTARDASAS